MSRVEKAQGVIEYQSLGIDISKDKIDCCFSVMLSDRSIKVKCRKVLPNNENGFIEIIRLLTKWFIKDMKASLVMEATGVYYERLAYYFANYSRVKVSVVLPNKVKSYANSLGTRTKTDRVDAQILAQMGLERNLEVWEAPHVIYRQLRNLGRERLGLVEEKTMVSNQLHAEEHSAEKVERSIKRYGVRIDLLETQIKEVEADMKELVVSSDELKEAVARLSSIEGVGFLTAAVVIGETDGFHLIKSRAQLTAYAGLDVVEFQSGSSVKKASKISKRGNRYLRKAVYFPAVCQIRQKNEFYNIYERVRNKSGQKKKGLVAVSRKILCLMYTLHKNKTDYNPKYQEEKIAAKDLSAKTKVGSTDVSETAYTA